MKIKDRLIDASLAVSATLLGLAAISAFYFQTSFVTVTSRSMEPTIKAGDTLLARQISTSDINRNDIVILPYPDVEGLRYTHRVTSVKNDSGEIFVTTKGDANPKPDSWTLQITSEKVPKVIAVIPTEAIFTGPIERRWIFYGFLYGGAALGLYASWRLVRRSPGSSM